MSKSTRRLELDAEIERRIAEATQRLAAAERELTLAMEAITLPDADADNVIVGERLRAALHELSTAKLALALERVSP